MKKFTFPLQAVLTLRQMRLDEALRAYAESMQNVAARQREFQSAQKKVDELIAVLSPPEGARFSATDQSTKLAALDHAREHLVKKGAELDEAKKQQAEKLAAFRTARHKAELLDRLRDKQHGAHKAATERREELELEELALARIRVEKTREGPINQATMQHREE